MINTVALAPALVGVITGFVTAVALYQVALLRKVALLVAAGLIAFAYFHGGMAELMVDAEAILRHLARERVFWAGVLGGKLLATLFIIPVRRA